MGILGQDWCEVRCGSGLLPAVCGIGDHAVVVRGEQASDADAHVAYGQDAEGCEWLGHIHDRERPICVVSVSSVSSSKLVETITIKEHSTIR